MAPILSYNTSTTYSILSCNCEATQTRRISRNKKVSKLPHLSKFVDDISRQLCKKHISDSHIVLKSLDLSCAAYLSTTQMVAGSVTSQNNLKNL